MLEELTLHQLDQEVEAVEALIDRTAEIDPWCSCPDWVLSTHYAFASAVEPLVLTNSERTGYALLARYVNEENTPIVTSLEPMWGFASPVIAADPATFGSELANHLNELDGWDTLALPGLPLPKANGSYTVKLLQSLSILGHVRAGSGITRQVARISASSGGYSGWLERRSPKFRRNLKRIQQAADDAGVSIIDASGDEFLFDRILDIEKLSWKGAQNSGITSSEMRALYSLLTIRLEEKGRLQVWIAQQDGRDIGYILGAVRNQLYRGLQVSYVEGVSDLSIGHLLQHHQIRALTSGDAVAERYDLGMDIDYKQSWADFGEPSIVLVLERSASEGI